MGQLRFFFHLSTTEIECAPHEIQQRKELSAFGPRHPTGAVTDENVSQRFRCQARHPFVSDAAAGTRRGRKIEEAAASKL